MRALIALAFFLVYQQAGAQSLPVDHWANWYLQVAQVLDSSGQWNGLVYPLERSRVGQSLNRNSLSANGSQQGLPSWTEALMKAEYRREIRQAGDSLDATWDQWDVGVTLLNGDRPVAHTTRPGFFMFGQGIVHFSPSLLAYVRVRATDDAAGVPAYTGVTQQIRRGIFNSAEADYAYFQYRHRWLTARVGRFKFSWGPTDDESIWLSSWGPSYDGVDIELRYHRFAFEFFSSHLETIPFEGRNVQRYLAGHFLRYSNGRTLWLGVGETILYDGPDRPLSLAYTNPLMTYIEYETNNRDNDATENRDNWFLSLMVDYFPVRGFRVYANYLVDEIQIDSRDRARVPDAVAWRVGTAWSFRFLQAPWVLGGDYVRVGPWTYKHQSPFTNYRSRGLLLGYPLGSDGDRLRVSVTTFPWRYLTSRWSFAYARSGERNILDNPEERKNTTLRLPFPSGTVEKNISVGLDLRYQPRYNLWLEFGGSLNRYENRGNVRRGSRFDWRGYVRLSTYLRFSFYPTRSLEW